MGRRKKPEEHSHSESWLVSYCDMISLLVTFFLMMMTFSTKDTADVREQTDGFSISFDLASSFAPGSAEPTQALEQNMRTLGSFLQRYTQLVVIEGFTDDRFQPTPQYPDAEAISIARAQAAAKILLQGSLISPEQVQIAGLGPIRPRAQNDSPLGRTSNRRIEVRVVSLASQQLVYAEHNEGPAQKPAKR